MTTTPPTPTTVEPGQIWRDNDPRSKGAGEFEVVAVIGAATSMEWADGEFGRTGRLAVLRARRAGDVFAIVRRADGRRTRINTDRLLYHTGRKSGYTYLGRGRG